MRASIIIAGYNSLIVESLHHVFEHKGYKTSIEKGNFRNVLNSIEIGDPEIVIWDDAYVRNDFQSILNLAYTANKDLSSVFILNSQMLHHMAEGLLHGVKGFLHRASSLNDAEHCLKDVLKGRIFISSQFTGRQEGFFENERSGLQKEGGLTKRERTILTLIAQKKTSREIAELLHISFRTVQNHCQNMRNKLGLKGPGALQMFAMLHEKHTNGGIGLS